MPLTIAARHELVERARPEVVLLEGSCPQEGRSLDDAIDARFAWIDQTAAEWADALQEQEEPLLGAATLNALALRYYLVKLLRVVAYFTEVQPLRAGDDVELVVQRGRDEDYAELVGPLCRSAGASFQSRWIERSAGPTASFPPNRPWRRAAARVCRWLEPRLSPVASPRVVLCGNPRLLEPVAETLLGRGCRLWWLYDRFALGSWVRWRPRGVGQLWCDASEGRENRLPVPEIGPMECRGVDLAGPLRRWFAARQEAYGPRQTRMVRQLAGHFDRLRPQALVLDEDATPLARAAVAAGRERGTASLVVQHGAPCCRFGFAPLFADRILAWGPSSADELGRWGVPAERIAIVGSPQHDRLYRALAAGARTEPRRHAGSPKNPRPRRILLLATVPPRDDRPDAVWLHMTRRGYAGMLRAAVATVAAIPEAHLVVKLHPRAPHDPDLARLLADHPLLASSVVRTGSLEESLRGVDCVLSCGSSAGIDATLAGVPVIQLLPAGSGEILPHGAWGLVGTARGGEELRRLLAAALAGDDRPMAVPNPRVFHGVSGSAERIVEAVLDAVKKPERPLRRSVEEAVGSGRR